MPPQILCFVEGKPEPDGPAYAGSSGKRLFACPVKPLYPPEEHESLYSGF